MLERRVVAFLALAVMLACGCNYGPRMQYTSKTVEVVRLLPCGEDARLIGSYETNGGDVRRGEQRFQWETDSYFFETDSLGYIVHIKEKAK